MTQISSTNPALSHTGNPVVDEFFQRFTLQAGSAYFAKTPTEVVSIVNELIKSRGSGQSCCIPKLGIFEKGKRIDIQERILSSITFSEFQSKPRETAAKLDVGITKADYGVAETGTIVDISYSDESRLLSSISRVHIAVLEASGILAKLQDLAPTMTALLGERVRDPRPSITFIGGPSRTSDIEIKSVLGVHGPHEVHVVIYG